MGSACVIDVCIYEQKCGDLSIVSQRMLETQCTTQRSNLSLIFLGSQKRSGLETDAFHVRTGHHSTSHYNMEVIGHSQINEKLSWVGMGSCMCSLATVVAWIHMVAEGTGKGATDSVRTDVDE